MCDGWVSTIVECTIGLLLYKLQLQAIQFAMEQDDDDLWEDLIKYSRTKPSM